ncbi:MAG TPA: HEAT repeat domain-containing protein, partial [Pirellulales bacterium]
VTGFGSPCGMCFYEGDAFGAKYKNVPFHADAGPREVRIYPHKVAGFGMTATSENVLTTDPKNPDNYFRPDDVCAMPDGSLIVSDWYDGGVGGHAYNDPTRGRIFRLTPKGKTLARVGKPGPYETAADALEALRSPNLATQFLAREKLIAEGEKALPELKKLAGDSDKNTAARALWLADRIGGAGREIVAEQLKSENPSFRALAVRILRRHGAEFADKLLPLVKDPADEVVREVLLAAGKLNTPAAFAAIVEVAKKFDGKDRYELETINIAAKDRKDQLYAALDADKAWTLDKLQLLQVIKPEAATKLLLDRLASEKLDAANSVVVLNAAALIPDVGAGRGLLALAANKEVAPEVRKEALARVGGNLAGSWQGLKGDEALTKALASLLADPELQTDGLAFARKHNIKSLDDSVRLLAGLKTAPLPTRVQAIAALAELEGPDNTNFLRGLLTDSEDQVKAAALDALVKMQDVKTLRDVLALGKGDAGVQATVAKKLMETAGGALVLLRMIDAKEVSEDVKKTALASAANHPDSNVRTFYEKFVPEEMRPKKLGTEIKPDVILALKGDKNRGAAIFNNSTAAQCKNCHVVQGKGVSLGPDLSLIGRKYGPAAMLETILEPSKAISHEFVPYILETTDGRVFAGFLIEKTDSQVTIKDIKGNLIRVAADEIDTLEEQKKSLMPELVLKDVTAQDAADLLAYLGSLTEGVQTLSTVRVTGPFAAKGGVNGALEPEQNAGSPDLKAQFKTFSNKSVGWDVSQAEDMGGFLGWSTNKLCEAKNMPQGDVALYFLSIVNSPSEQEVGVSLG